MAKRQGTNILLCYKDSTGYYKQFAYAKSCEFSISRDMQEIASPTSGQAREYIPGRYDWDMSLKCIYDSDQATIMEMLIPSDGSAPEAIDVMWRDETPGGGTVPGTLNKAYSGTAYIKNFKASAQIHDMASAQISLQGTGTLTCAEWGDTLTATFAKKSDDVYSCTLDREAPCDVTVVYNNGATVNTSVICKGEKTTTVVVPIYKSSYFDVSAAVTNYSVTMAFPQS